MALELLAAIVTAIACAGIVLVLRKIMPGVLPKWAMPFGAALGLLGATVWLEYDWFNRVSAKLPAQMEVIWQAEEAQPLRPWTYLLPITTQFMAIDRSATAAHPEVASLRMAHVYSFGRWAPVQDRFFALDCAAQRQVQIAEGVQISPEGTLTGAQWQPAAADDPIQAAACQEG